MAHYRCDCGAEDCPNCHNQEEWLSEDGYTAKQEREIDAYLDTY